MDQNSQEDMHAVLDGRAVIRVEEAARLLGLGRSAAYEAARRGELPTVRMGRRLLVPVPRLLALLGAEPAGAAPLADLPLVPA